MQPKCCVTCDLEIISYQMWHFKRFNRYGLVTECSLEEIEGNLKSLQMG